MVILKKIVFNSNFQSAIFGMLLASVIIVLWDVPIKKYTIDINPFERPGADGIYWISGDFNNDGHSEYLRCYNSEMTGAFNIVHYDRFGNITVNWHMNSSSWDYFFKPAVYDIDRNGSDDLLFFTTRNDSVFFNAFSLSDFHLSVDHHFFAEFQQKRKNYAFRSEFSGFGDFDQNGEDELFFWFDAGFGLYPRGIFRMDFPSLKISASPTEHMLLSFSSFKDFNQDGIPEILTHSAAPNNSFFSHKYTDSVSYITVLDYDLNFMFEPIPMEHEYSAVKCIPSPKKDSLFYACFINRSDDTEPLHLMTLNGKGEILAQKKWSNLQNNEARSVALKLINSVPYIILKNIGRFRLTKSLENIPEKLELSLNKYDENPYCFDLNGDGHDELIFWNLMNEITIVNEAKNAQVIFESPLPVKSNFTIYPVLEEHKIVKHMFTSESGFFFVDYRQNENYYLLYLIYFVIFLISGGSIRALLFLQQRTFEKKIETEKQLSELQFNAVKNQLNPHFLFNALNSVAFMINNGKKEDAYGFLTVNSRMIQRVMDDSNEVKRSLKDEIQFTKDYLEIQTHRFKDKFQTRFIIHPEVDLNFKVPKMCIHTYVENAVKHGFRNTQKDGILEIEIEPEKTGIKITVTDNGMGRKAAAEYKDSSGNGLKIMNEYYRLFEKYHGYHIEIKMVDLSPNQNSQTGTRVELKILNKEK